jgi:hypothetical protein
VDITWRSDPSGQSWRAWDEDGTLVGGVVGVDGASSAPHWLAWVRWKKLPGQHATLEEAKAAVEAALKC